MIAASILSADFSRLGDEIRRLEEAGVDWIHVDVMDGCLVPDITVGVPVIESIRPLTKLPFDIHLMILDPDRYVNQFRNAGADYLSRRPEPKLVCH